MKVGMKLTDAQTAQIVETYDVDGNHELDVDEFMKLISELIDASKPFRQLLHSLHTPQGHVASRRIVGGEQQRSGWAALGPSRTIV